MDILVRLCAKKWFQRKCLFVLLLSLPLVSLSQNQTPSETNATVLFDSVTVQAKQLAGQNYVPPQSVPLPLAELSFDQYRAIRFKKEKALWRGEALFEIQLLHPGFLYREPVAVHLIDRGGSRKELRFNPELFSYDAGALPDSATLVGELGFAGFRVHYPLNSASYKDEFLVFQGASYFRLVGPNQVYGLSARGLAAVVVKKSVASEVF